MKFKLVFYLLVLMNWSFCLIASDMLGVKERAVIYFFPSEAEIEIITTNDEEYAEILNDYFYYQDRMVEYLKKNGIKSINSSASVIRVQYEGNNNFEYNRKKDISKIGYILTDGLKKPKILFGVYTGIDLMFELQSYFDINK